MPMHKSVPNPLLRILAAMLVCALLILPVRVSNAENTMDGMVRVKLTRLGSNASIAFQTTCDYYVDGQPSLRIGAGESATVSANGSELYLTVDGQRISMGNVLFLRRSQPGQQGVRFTSPATANLYCGDLYLTASSSILSVIFNIYIEDYLYGVVGYEMSPSWPLEALKAQAVAARSYALQKMSQRKDQLYHLVDNTSNQVFKGLNTSSSYASVIQAVDGTRGIALYSGSNLASCYYSASNGGQTESTKNAWGSALSYSIVQDDPYDLASSAATKTAQIRKDAQGLNASLQSALAEGIVAQLAASGVVAASDGVTIDRIESVTARNPRFSAPSRLYQTLTFSVRATVIDANGQTASGVASVDVPTYGGLESWYSLSINSGNNETVWVDETDDAFYVRFRRYGHGVGMSQRGAQVMARDHGWTAAQILMFYYPGTEARQLNLTDSTTDQSAPEYTVIATAKAADGATLYASASTDSRKIALLSAGTALDIYAVNGSWAAAGSNGVTGFVPTSHLTSYVPAGAQVTVVEGEKYATVSASDGAALRELPVETATRIAQLPEGTRVRVHAYAGEWAAVSTADGQAGYIPIPALTAQEATPTPTPTPMPTIVVPEEDTYAKVTAAGGTDLLYWPDSQSLVALHLEQGSFVRVQAVSGEWAKVLTPSGAEGFVLCAHLTLVAAPTPTPTPTSNPEVVVPEDVMYAKAQVALQVYQRPDASSTAVAQMRAGEYALVLAYTRQWVQVMTVTGTEGYVPIGQLQVVSAEEVFATATPAPTAEVVVPSSPMYAQATVDTPVYGQASTASTAVAQLSRGEVVRVAAYTSEWAQVQTQSGAEGFVPLSRLQVVSAPTPTPELGEIYVPDGEMYARATADTPVYSYWSTSSGHLTNLSTGTYVRVVAYTRTWVRVRTTSGVEGFVPIGKLVVSATPKPEATPEPELGEIYVPDGEMYARATADTPVYSYWSTSSGHLTNLSTGTYVCVVAYTRTWVRVQTASGVEGFVPIGKLVVVYAPAATQPPSPGKVTVVSGTQYRYVSVESAGMYRSYSASSGRIQTLPYGTRVQIGAYNADWACVKYGDQIGFILLDHLTARSPVSSSAGDVIAAEFNVVTTANAPVYTAPSTSAAAMGMLAPGVKLRVYAYNNAFAYVGAGTNRGFMELRYLRIVVG